MPIRTIRVRLTLWYAGILLLILGFFAAGIYFTMRRTLTENLDDALQNRAFLTEELLVFDSAGEPALTLTNDARDPNRGESFQRLLDARGTVLFDNSSSFGEVAIDDAAFAAALSGGRHTGTHSAGDEARVLSVPVEHEGAVVGVLQVGESTEDLNRTLERLLLVFAISLPAALVLSTVVGYWLASRALGPIDKITRAADDIGEHDLSRRLDLDLPDDEVGRLAHTFDRMIGRLDLAFQRQRQFTADASHELRTPLAAIRGQVEVLSKRRPKEIATYERVVDAIGDQAERMTRLVGGLLMLARGDADALPVEHEPVLIPEVVESVVDQMRPAAEQKGLVLQVKGEGAPEVMGDDDLLVQLLLNLVDNAIKYTDRGGVRVGWWTEARLVHIDVTDTGVGISAEHQPRVFERFYRVDVARSRTSGGTGLGLAICKWIAEEHGGTIRVQSTDSGSTFTVTLPLAQFAPQSHPSPRAATREA